MAEPLKRITKPTSAVLTALLAQPTEPLYGLEIASQAGLKAGTLYPILRRLEDHEWVTSSWEQIDSSEEQRPRRRYYKLTGEGISMARAALSPNAVGGVRLAKATF